MEYYSNLESYSIRKSVRRKSNCKNRPKVLRLPNCEERPEVHRLKMNRNYLGDERVTLEYPPRNRMRKTLLDKKINFGLEFNLDFCLDYKLNR